MGMENESCYVQEAVKNCAVHIAATYGGRFRLPKKAENPFKMDYGPELDTNPEFDSVAVSYYLTIISLLRWMIELGRTNMIIKVSLLSSHVALPRERHFNVRDVIID